MVALKSPNWNAGFTLVEMIVVIVIAGIVAGMVAVFIRSPVEGYMDAQRRAELTDVADTAVRRMARDIRSALPNSVRTSDDGSGLCVEYMPTKIGARYRAVKDGTGNGDPLSFTLLDSGLIDASFDMLWLNSALPQESLIREGDVVVVYNDGMTPFMATALKNSVRAGL
ncbi:MAG: prepilin-type N-terminal cleavage/methylation domain-containing protein, partial [Betaproteobacteria bacterium]